MTPEQFAASEAFYESDSLYVHPQTPISARLSCGGVIEATLAVARGELDKTFAIVRPPGHHAEPNRPMGFCFFNNVAIAVKIVRDLTDIKKILILDWCESPIRFSVCFLFVPYANVAQGCAPW